MKFLDKFEKNRKNRKKLENFLINKIFIEKFEKIRKISYK